MLVKDWRDKRTEEDLNQITVEMELKAMEKTLAQFNVEQLRLSKLKLGRPYCFGGRKKSSRTDRS